MLEAHQAVYVSRVDAGGFTTLAAVTGCFHRDCADFGTDIAQRLCNLGHVLSWCAKRDLTTSWDTLPQLCSSDPRPRANATEGLDSPTDLPAKSEQKESRDDE